MPEIQQHDVQVLIWEIQAKVKPSQLSSEAYRASHKLLTPEELLSLEGGGWDFLKAQSGGPSIFGSLPGPVQRIMEAENELRNKFYSGNSSYAELESIAVLNGDYKPQKGDREIPRGRWSYNKDGYFISFYPYGYSHTTEYLYFPEKFEVTLDGDHVTLIKDPAGRQVKVENGEASFVEGGEELGHVRLNLDKRASDKRKEEFEKLLSRFKLDTSDAKKLAALADIAAGLGKPEESWQVDAQQMAFHAWMASFAESARTAEDALYAFMGEAPSSATGSYDPSGGVATPGETGRQRLAQSGRCQHGGSGNSDFQNSVANAMRSKGYDVGADNIFVYDQGDHSGLLRFVVRLNKNGKPLPTADCVAESNPGPGSQEGAKELLLGSVQSAGDTYRTNIRSVDVETGTITGAGRGDGQNFSASSNNAFNNYHRL
jgi:hypothetical protein